jgi:hypothetical protein
MGRQPDRAWPDLLESAQMIAPRGRRETARINMKTTNTAKTTPLTATERAERASRYARPIKIF